MNISTTQQTSIHHTVKVDNRHIGTLVDRSSTNHNDWAFVPKNLDTVQWTVPSFSEAIKKIKES